MPIVAQIHLLAPVRTQALKHYSQQDGPHRAAAEQAHDELREALLSNMQAMYKETRFLWENYDDAEGFGKGSHPFTGWSALVVLIAAELY